jgi:hypothetical protein
MEQFSFQLPVGAPPSLLALLINMAVGLLLLLGISKHFERFGSTLSNRSEFALVFPFIVLTTTLIITVVKTSLALSLGLVGALSIVCFRTPIKEPEELAYLCLAIAIPSGDTPAEVSEPSQSGDLAPHAVDRHAQNLYARPNLLKRARLPDLTVAEVKFGRADERLGNRFIQGIPIRVSRNSKYVVGVAAIRP